MLAIIIIIPNTLGYKSTPLNLAYKVLQYLVPTYLSNITSNTSARAKYSQFTLTIFSLTSMLSFFLFLCLEHSYFST